MEADRRTEPRSVFETIDRYLTRLENGLDLAAGVAIGVVMLFAVAQVTLRKVFNLPIFGYIDIVEQSVALFAFLGAAYAQREGNHVRMDLLLNRLSKRPLYLVEIITTFASVVIVGAIAWNAFGHFLRAWTFGDSTMDAQLPTWPTKLLVPLALGILTLRLMVNLYGYVRLAFDTDLDPVGVPKTYSLKEQAQKAIPDNATAVRGGGP